MSAIAVPIVMGLTVALTGVACAPNIAPSHARAYLIEVLRRRVDTPQRQHPLYSSLEQVLPNALFRTPQGEGPLTDAVVAGRVAAVEKGRGFTVREGDSPDSVQTPFDDRSAMWKTLHISLRVEWATVNQERIAKTVRVGLAVDGSADFAHLKAGLFAIGRVVLFLIRESPVFAYDPSLYAIVDDGGLIATVDSRGRLALPMLPQSQAPSLLARVATLDALEREARRSPYLVQAL